MSLLHQRRRRRQKRKATQEGPLARIEQGEGGERALQDWLDRSRLLYLFLDQTPLTIPISHRAHIKRPDFLVGLEGMGTVALDAKAKSLARGWFTLDLAERRRLDGFEAFFAMPVWYVCFPPGERSCMLLRNRALMGSAVEVDGEKQMLRAPLSLGLAVNPSEEGFGSALRRAGVR